MQIKKEKIYTHPDCGYNGSKQLRTEHALNKLEAVVMDNQFRQMRQNLVFYGVPETSSENTMDTVCNVLAKKMKIAEGRIKKPGFIKGDISMDIGRIEWAKFPANHRQDLLCLS